MYIFDAHCDYLWMKAIGEKTQLQKNETYKKSIFAVFEGSMPDKTLIEKEIKAFYGEKPVDEAYLAFEGLSWVHSLWDLEDIIKYDPVYVGPMWNNKNEFGGSAYDDMPITIFGKCFLKEIENNNIYIDLAHSGRKMFDSCIYNFENVIFSHGNISEIYEHPRNLKRDQVLKLINRKSFLGLTLYSGFVGAKSIEKLFEHIEYVLNLGGEKILGFGSDLDGCENIVGKFGDVRVFDEIIEEFYKRNYSERLIKALLYKNLEYCIEKKNKKTNCSQKSR